MSSRAPVKNQLDYLERSPQSRILYLLDYVGVPLTAKEMKYCLVRKHGYSDYVVARDFIRKKKSIGGYDIPLSAIRGIMEKKGLMLDTVPNALDRPLYQMSGRIPGKAPQVLEYVKDGKTSKYQLAPAFWECLDTLTWAKKVSNLHNKVISHSEAGIQLLTHLEDGANFTDCDRDKLFERGVIIGKLLKELEALERLHGEAGGVFPFYVIMSSRPKYRNIGITPELRETKEYKERREYEAARSAQRDKKAARQKKYRDKKAAQE